MPASDMSASWVRCCGSRRRRKDGRSVDQLRPVSFERDFTVMAPGSVLVTLVGPGSCAPRRSRSECRRGCEGPVAGWVTAEYSMLPGSTPERASREAARGSSRGGLRRSSG